MNAGWYPDPSGRFDQRYWDGRGWTSHVSRGAEIMRDEPVIAPIPPAQNPQIPMHGPTAASRRSSRRRGYMRLPMWAKVAAPLAAIVAVSVVATLITTDGDKADPNRIESVVDVGSTSAPTTTTTTITTLGSTATTPTTTAAAPAPPTPTDPPVQSAVITGAFCAPDGALGRTTAGLSMRCARNNGEERARWRPA